MVNTVCFQCRVCGFVLWSENWDPICYWHCKKKVFKWTVNSDWSVVWYRHQNLMYPRPQHSKCKANNSWRLGLSYFALCTLSSFRALCEYNSAHPHISSFEKLLLFVSFCTWSSSLCDTVQPGYEWTGTLQRETQVVNAFGTMFEGWEKQTNEHNVVNQL